MTFTDASKSRNRIVRGFFILGAVFFLVKGQSGFCATPDCSGDPVAAAVELVLPDPPDYGFQYLQAYTQVTSDEMASAPAPCDHHPEYGWVSASYDGYARAVLKSSEQVFICQPRRSLIRKTIAMPLRSPDADPPPTC